MSDETNPIQPQEIPAAPTMPTPPVAAPAPATQVASEPVAPAVEAPVAKPVAPTPTPVAKPAVSNELPKARYVAPKPASVAPMKTVEVKKDENPSIASVAVDFIAAAVAVAFAVMIILDI